MFINQIMALLLPGVVTLKVYEKLEGEENRIQKNIKKYLKAVLLINLAMYLIVIYLVKKPEFTFTNQFTVKYILLATVIAIIYPVIEKFIRDNVSLDVEVKAKSEKED